MKYLVRENRVSDNVRVLTDGCTVKDQFGTYEVQSLERQNVLGMDVVQAECVTLSDFFEDKGHTVLLTFPCVEQHEESVIELTDSDFESIYAAQIAELMNADSYPEKFTI